MPSSGSKSSKRSKKFKRGIQNVSNRVGISPARILGGFLLLVGLGSLLAWVVLQNSDQTSADRRTPANQETLVQQRLEVILQNTSVSLSNEEPILLVERMRTQLELLDEIEKQHKLSADQQKILALSRLKAELAICVESTVSDFGGEQTRESLLRRCTDLIETHGGEVAEQARFARVVLCLIDFETQPNETSFQKFEQSLNDNSDGYLNNLNHSVAMMGIAEQFCRERKKGEFNMRLCMALGKAISQSPIDQIRTAGENFGNSSMFVDFDLATLPRRIARRNLFAADDLNGALETLESNRDTGLETFLAILTAYESYFSTDQVEEAGASWQTMYRIVDSLEEGEKKTLLQASLTRQRQRAELIGKPFDASGLVAGTNEEFEIGDGKYTAILFSDRSTVSTSMMRNYSQASKSFPTNVQTVVAFVDEMTNLDFDSLSKIPLSIIPASPQTTKRYQEDFPVDFLPYLILLDRDGKIAYINLQTFQLVNRVAALDANVNQRANGN